MVHIHISALSGFYQALYNVFIHAALSVEQIMDKEFSACTSGGSGEFIVAPGGASTHGGAAATPAAPTVPLRWMQTRRTELNLCLHQRSHPKNPLESAAGLGLFSCSFGSFPAAGGQSMLNLSARSHPAIINTRSEKWIAAAVIKCSQTRRQHWK